MYDLPDTPFQRQLMIIRKWQRKVAGIHLHLSNNPPPGLPKIMADRHRIAQVLGNLLTNALRHTPGAAV
jgi:signal transduction histidine kinase